MKKVKKSKKEKMISDMNQKAELCEQACELCGCSKNNYNTRCTGAGYMLGAIGAAVYYISVAPSFWIGVWGVIKALLWPAFLVYEVLKFVGA